MPGARRRRLGVAARERAARRAGRAGAPGDARAPVRGRHQLRLPGGALRARVPRGGADALPRRRARACDRAAARRLDGGRPGRAGRRAVARARRPLRRAARGRLPRGRRGHGDAPVRARARRAGRRADPGEEAAERFAALVTALRLWAPRRRRRSARPAGARPTRGAGSRCRSAPACPPRGERLGPSGRATSRRSASSSRRSRARPPTPSVAWALDRFEMGCAQRDRRRGAVRLPARAARAARRDHRRRATRASACGWRRCAPRRASAARCRSASRPRSRWSAS